MSIRDEKDVIAIEEDRILIDGLDFLEKELQQEKKERQLLLKVAASASLDDLLSEIMEYLQERWGFNAFQVQLVNEESNTLELYKYYGMEQSDQRINNAIGKNVSLETSKESISAYVARKQKVIYADFDSMSSLNGMSEIDREAINALGIIENLILPIVIDGKSVGVIHLFSLKKRLDLTRQIISDIEVFIMGVSGLVQTSKKNEELERGKKKQGELIKLIGEISKTIDIERLMELFAETLIGRVHYDGILAAIIDDKSEALICEMVNLPNEYKGIEKTYKKFRLSLDMPEALVESYKTKKTAFYDKKNIVRFSETTKYQFDGWRMKSMLVLPIVVSGDSLGAIMVFSQSFDFSYSDLEKISEIIPLFGDQILSSVTYSRLKEQEKNIRHATKLNEEFLEFIARVNNLTSIEMIYKLFSEEILRRFHFDFASVYMCSNEEIQFKKLTCADSRLKNEHRKLESFMESTVYKLNMHEGSLATVLLKNLRVYIPDVQEVINLPMSEKDRKSIKVLGTNRTVLQVPIRVQDKPIGVLGLYAISEVVELSEVDLQMIELLCSFMGTTIANANLYSTVGAQKDEIEKAMLELKDTQQQLVETERRRAEAMKEAKELAEASTQAKSSFLANMSHEIRTPLNAITGLLELTLKTNLDQKQHDYLTKIGRASDSLLGIINDILDFSKIEAGKLEMENVEFNLCDSLDLIVDLFAERICEKNLELVVSMANDIPLKVIGDPLRLNQILINLVSNAIKFTEKGYIRISVVMLESESDDISLEFVVEDTGVGMPRDKINHLFESFTQADGSTTRKYGGTGLGLSICKSIAEMMGGRVWADSVQGKGSTFCFLVYLKKTAENEQVVTGQQLECLRGKIKNVFVVDDSIVVRTFIKNLLAPLDIKVTSASTRKSIEKNLEKGDFDLFFCDWNLKNFKSMDLCRRVAQYKKNKNKPFVFMLAGGEEGFRFQAESAGMRYFLDKPLRQKDLIELICKIEGVDTPNLCTIKTNNLKIDSVNIEKISGARILLIEDNEINQQVARELLEDAFMYVDIAPNAIEAMDFLKEHDDYDAILTDIRMPGMDGYQFAKRVRMKKRYDELPIIALTADAMQDDKEKCLQAGMNDHLAKPINVSQLYLVLAKWIKDIERVPNVQLDKKEKTDAKDALPGVDIVKALSSMGGNRSLLDKVIISFCREYSDVTECINNLYHAGDKEGARVISHTLKGVIGTFASDVIHKLAIHLDDVLKRDAVNEFGSALEKFARAINPIFMSGRILEKNRKTPLGKSVFNYKTELNSKDIGNAEKLLQEVDKLLLVNNYCVKDIIPKLRKIIGTESITELLDTLEESIYRFDFDSARKYADLIKYNLY